MAKTRNNKNLVKMTSSAGTGSFYVTHKNPRATEKLKFSKYDPVTRKHEIFEEKKMPNPKG